MLNTFVLMLALALSPAEAAHKHHKHHKHYNPPPRAHAHVVHHRAPTPRAHRVLAWTRIPGHYDIHGRWIRARWTFGVKVTI
jgi:hypothetical protein